MLFTGIGVYAWNREKPMWFWSGSTVSEDEISDVEAYNRANGIMWICFSLPLWISTVVGYFYAEVGVALMVADFVLGLPALRHAVRI